MVGHGKNFARAAIEQFQTQFLLDREPAVLAEEAIQVNRRVHVRDAVFGKQNHLHRTLVEKINQVADDGVNRAQVGNDGGIELW